MLEPIREHEGRSVPRASVVVPVLDGGEPLGALLAALQRQRLEGGLEVIVVDSGSRDDSLERAMVHDCRVFRTRSFGHGRTRNAALAVARAPLAVLLTQDAEPLGETFVETLIEPLEQDLRVAGSYARQIAPEGCDPLVAAALERWCPDGPDRRQRALGPAAFAALTPAARARRCRFDNVASCVRLQAWRSVPFPDVPFGEDAVWAKRVLLAGHDIVYRASATVVHVHVTGPRGAFHRDRLGHTMLASEFALRSVPTPLHGAVAWIGGWRGDWRDLRSRRVPLFRRAPWLARGALRRIGALAGQFAGGRRGIARFREASQR